MQSRKVETEVRNCNCIVSSDSDCDVAKDFSTSFVSKVTSGDVCTVASSKTLARIPDFNFHYLFPKHSRERRVHSRKCRASNECCDFDEEKVGQNSASPFQRSGVNLIDVKKEPSVLIDVKTEPSVFLDVKKEPSVLIDVKKEPCLFIDVKKEPSVTSNMSSDTPMMLEQVIPDFAFIMKTICENHIVIQSIMMLLLNCHPELAFDKVTLELAAFREFMLLKLNKDKTDEIAAEAISLYWQRQNQLLAQKETASHSKNHEDSSMCKTVQCHSEPILLDQHFVPNHPSCWSIAPEHTNHKKSLLQLSEGSGNQLSKSYVPHVNRCQLPVPSSMRNSVTDDVSTVCAISCMIKNCVDIQKGQNKNCQCGNLMPLASLECSEKACSLVQSSVDPDLCQKGCKTSVTILECDDRKIDSVCNSFHSFLSLPVECSNSASMQTGAVTGVSCMPSVYSQREKPVAADCRSVISKSPVVTRFLTSKLSQRDDIKANATSAFGFNYQTNEHELSGTAAVEEMLAYSSDSMPNVQSFSNLCLQEFLQTEPKTKEELNLQEIIHLSMASVATKTESRLQSCVAVIQPNEVTAIDAVIIQSDLNNFESIPSKKIVSSSNVRLSCQNNIEQLGRPSFDDQKNTTDRRNPKDVEICARTRFGDGSRVRNVSRLEYEKELLGDQRSAVTDLAKPVLNRTNVDDTFTDVSANAGQMKLLIENSQCNNKSNGKQFSNVHQVKSCNQKQSPMYKDGTWKKKNLQRNFSQRFCYSPPSYRSSGCVKLPADHKEVGRLAEHSTISAANNGYWSVFGHQNFNRLSHPEKADACRADLQGLVKREIVPNVHQESRLYILHCSYAVSSEHSMCNCNKEPDWDSGFSGFNLRPELREVFSELNFEVPTKVQWCCLRPLLDGLDVICAEGSGAGKTTLLALSTLQHLQSSSNQVAILVLCHTYRAMVAVYDCFRQFSAYMNNVRAHILSEGFESHQHLQRHEPQILIGSVQSVLQLTYVRPDLFCQLKHFILEDCDVMLRQADVCKNIERIAEFVPQEKQVILVCRKMFPLIGNMFKKLVPYKVKMTTHSF